MVDIVTRLRLWASVTEGDHVIEELHRAADEIERLRADIEERAKLMSKIVELLVPFSMLMNKHEQELLVKAVRGE
jgi:hypothetical protein